MPFNYIAYSCSLSEILSTSQIHAYMLSKAPPVPETLNQASEDHHNEKDCHAEGIESAGRSEDAIDPEDGEGEIIVEEPQAPLENANIVDHRDVGPRQVRAEISNLQQVSNRPARRVQRSTDDRFLTWAAVGLSIAIAFLLLRKLAKSSGYGAIFLSES